MSEEASPPSGSRGSQGVLRSGSAALLSPELPASTGAGVALHGPGCPGGLRPGYRSQHPSEGLWDVRSLPVSLGWCSQALMAPLSSPRRPASGISSAGRAPAVRSACGCAGCGCAPRWGGQERSATPAATRYCSRHEALDQCSDSSLGVSRHFLTLGAVGVRWGPNYTACKTWRLEPQFLIY